uniref:Uncharacterized protein n=1 Tax=Anguilla anguilla TaxID=7936 RepID=A0A0E9QNN4_ANGAN
MFMSTFRYLINCRFIFHCFYSCTVLTCGTVMKVTKNK